MGCEEGPVSDAVGVLKRSQVGIQLGAKGVGDNVGDYGPVATCPGTIMMECGESIWGWSAGQG